MATRSGSKYIEVEPGCFVTYQVHSDLGTRSFKTEAEANKYIEESKANHRFIGYRLDRVQRQILKLVRQDT